MDRSDRSPSIQRELLVRIFLHIGCVQAELCSSLIPIPMGRMGMIELSEFLPFGISKWRICKTVLRSRCKGHPGAMCGF